MVIDPNRVKELFLGAAELPDETARTAYLDRACEGDAALRERVESLLHSHDTADSFLGSPAVQPPESLPLATQDVGGPATPEGTNEAVDDLQFLGKPHRPDSLGRIGHYEVLQVLGRGGFGIVFRAFDDMLQRVVAVKVMAPQLAATSPARKRFLREAQSSAAVRHEHVVQVYEVGEQPLPFLVMEFIPGETLQQKLDRMGPLEVPAVLRIGRQIAEGLAAAHASALIHRDIKPGNILLEGGVQKVKITDFGLARAADDASISQSGIVAGTPMFMAPEQALGQHIDQRADLGSLGSVLYQMVSGRPPFRAPSALAVLKRVAEESPRPIPEIMPETPDWLCGIIAKLHAKKPADRFQSAREVADLLADCEAKLKAKQQVNNIPPATVKPAATTASTPPSASVRRKWAVATVLLLSVIALTVTEFAGVTHLFRRQESLPGDTNGADGGGKEPNPKKVPDEKKDSSQAKDPDRRAAEYVLSIGGTIRIDEEERERTAADLPRAAFRLTGVRLEENQQVSDTGLAHFTDCKHLKALWIERTQVSDAGLKHLTGMTTLEVLYTSQNLATARGIEELAKTLPQCTIYWDGGVFKPMAVPPPPAPTIHDTWLKAIALLPLDQHAAALPARLKEQLPAFDAAFLRAISAMPADRQAIMAEAWLNERKPAFAGLEDTWLKTIPALSAETQVALVAAWLKERNPPHAGEVMHKIEGGVVTSLAVPSPLVQDLTPLRALTGLRSLTGRSMLGHDHKAESDAAVLRSLKKLEHINGKPVVQFWKDVEVKQSEFQEWLKLVPALAAEQQATAVAAKLKERNPGFDGEVQPRIEDGVVLELSFKSEKVTDVSPVRALMGLKGLNCAGGTLSDLSPLKGMPLTSLDIVGTRVQDVSPLKGMPLTTLHISGTRVEDLEPLRGMPLTTLHISGTKVRDLSPLKGMSLTTLGAHDCYEVADLAPLKGMPLTFLHLWQCPVADLAPLKGMPLTTFHFCGNRAQVQDLEPLRGMPLTELYLYECAQLQNLEPLKGLKLTALRLDGCPVVRNLTPLTGMPLTSLIVTDTGVTDLKPLQGMPLEEIRLTPKNITQGLDILRDMKSLKTIGTRDQTWPAAEFWEHYDKGEFK